MEDNNETFGELMHSKQAITKQVELNEGEVTDEQIEALCENAYALSQKVDRIAWVIDGLKHQADFYRKEASELSEIAKRFDNAANRIEKRVEYVLLQSGESQVKGLRKRFTLQKNPPSVDIIEELKIPSKFVREKITTAIDKKAIKEAFQAGEEVPGAVIKQELKLKIKPASAELPKKSPKKKLTSKGESNEHHLSESDS